MVVQLPQHVVDPSFLLNSPISFVMSPSIAFGQYSRPSSPSDSVLLGETRSFDDSLVCNTPEVVFEQYSRPLGNCSCDFNLMDEENGLDSPVICEVVSHSLE